MRRCARSFFVLVLIAWPAVAWGQDAPSFVELVVRVDRGSVALLQQSIRPGEMPGPRIPEFLVGSWVVLGEDAAGTPRFLTTIPNLRGRSGLPEEGATLLIRVPQDSHIVRLKLFRLTRSITTGAIQSDRPIALPPEALEFMGSVTLEIP